MELDLLTYLTIATGFLLLVASLLSIKYSRSNWVRVVITVIFISLLPISFQAYQELTGKPKWSQAEWYYKDIKKVQILAVRMIEEKGIYLYLLIPGKAEPYSYKFPWDKKMAMQIGKAIEEARRNRNGLFMRDPFNYEKSLEKRERKFYAPPQPKLPDKPRDKNKGKIMNHPSWKIRF